MSRVIDLTDAVVPRDGDTICQAGKLVRIHPDAYRVLSWLTIPTHATRHLANPVAFFAATLQLLATEPELRSINMWLTYDQWVAQYGVIVGARTGALPRFEEAFVTFCRDSTIITFVFAHNGIETHSAAHVPLSWVEENIAKMQDGIARRDVVTCAVDLTDALVPPGPLRLVAGWERMQTVNQLYARFDYASGPFHSLPAQLGRFADRLAGPPRILVDRRPDGSWIPMASFRWPYSHALITDAVLGLHALCLPAYVLYWIVDKLPPLQQWTEYKKIALIHSLLASIKKVSK